MMSDDFTMMILMGRHKRDNNIYKRFERRS